MATDEPEKAAWFEEQRVTMSDAEPGVLFVGFLKQHFEATGGRCRRVILNNAQAAVRRFN